MNINELNNIKRFYPIDKSLKKFNANNNCNKKLIYISNEEILNKINSDDFKKHPVYPIIINNNGEEIYDLRDNLKIQPRKNKRGALLCNILGTGKKMICRLTAESWHNHIISPNENVHHIDGDKNNNYFKNLVIIDAKEHVELHRK